MGNFTLRLATLLVRASLGVFCIAIAACTGNSSASSQPFTSSASIKASVLDQATPSVASVNGTSLPKTTQILDSGGNVWTVSGGVYENGVVVTPVAVTLVLYDNDTVYQEDGAGIWWSWNGSTWLLSSDPTMIASPAGTSIPTANQITDGSGNIWAVSNGIYENGVLVNPTDVTRLLYDNSTLYLLDSAGIWWWWSGNTWFPSNDPTATHSGNGTSIPAATQITDGGGNIWTVVGGVVYENGAVAGYSNAVTTLMLVNSVLFQENSAGSWWSWNGSTWAQSGDPSAASVVGSATLTWSAPTQNTDGTPLTNLAGYTIYYGLAPTALTEMIQLSNPTATSYVVSNLGAATYYFAVAAYSSAGWESANSTVVSKTITASMAN